MAVDQLLDEARNQIREVEPAAALAALDDMLVIDVREPWEVLHGYLPGAINVPRGLLEFRHLERGGDDPEARPILLVSGDGRRSALAALTLKQLGVDRVFSLAGGMSRWLREELPVA